MNTTKRTVTTRTRSEYSPETREFEFTRDMAPGLSDVQKTPAFLQEYRSRAWEAFRSQPIPTPSSEPWRRTDLHGLKASSFRLPDQRRPVPSRTLRPPRKLLRPLAGTASGGRIVLTTQGAQVELSPELGSMGVIFTDLRTAEQKYPEILSELMGKIVTPEEGKFAALAGAFAQTGILLYVPPNLHLEQPLQSLLWGAEIGVAQLSHLLVWVDEGASLTYVHEMASPTEASGQSLHSGLVEFKVAPSANLRFIELQSWGEHVWNFTHERVRLERDASLDWIFGATGSHLTKNFSELELVGQGANGRMSGFYFTDGVQHFDHDTQQNHFAPNTTSDLLFKGALRGKSRSVWQGMIYVAPGAQKTDGYQANRNLVLSPDARADSIPGLEILADDVRCTHGATVGKIDEDQVFYLRSRGIPYSEAERLVVEGFFDPIVQRIPYESLRSRIKEEIMVKVG